VDSLLAFVGFDKVKFEGNRLLKNNPNIRFNVNAYAPGYAADLIAAIFKSKNYQNYMIEIGGEVVASGLNAKKEPWLIGIERPEDNLSNQKNELVSGIKLNDRALATSGNYRRFYKKEGKKYAHTIDPKTGFPVQHSLLSATVLTPNAVDADAYATICMVLGKDEAIALFSHHPGVALYLIYADSTGDMQEYVSENLKDSFTSFR
jgi:thiamine biosynthesis lipoprotein